MTQWWFLCNMFEPYHSSNHLFWGDGWSFQFKINIPFVLSFTYHSRSKVKYDRSTFGTPCIFWHNLPQAIPPPPPLLEYMSGLAEDQGAAEEWPRFCYVQVDHSCRTRESMGRQWSCARAGERACGVQTAECRRYQLFLSSGVCCVWASSRANISCSHCCGFKVWKRGWKVRLGLIIV